jgi:2-hydroxy-3-keto-5-methylthiopentenyl-1-phosphate phosphatase
MKFLKSQKKYHNFYISTGTPQNKIVNILKEKKLFSFFKKIYGSPRSKVDHIKEIKKKNINIVFIGDSFEDFKASVETNIKFILKLNSENILFRKKINVKTIQSFKYLKKIFNNY